jgi:hypothetical protein
MKTFFTSPDSLSHIPIHLLMPGPTCPVMINRLRKGKNLNSLVQKTMDNGMTEETKYNPLIHHPTSYTRTHIC